MHAVGNGRIRIEQVLIAHLEPVTDRLCGRARDQRRSGWLIRRREHAGLDEEVGTGRPCPCAVILPGAAAQRRIPRPLLVHHGRRIGQHPAIELGMKPRHGEGRGAARAQAHGGAAFRIFRQLHAGVLFDQRQHLALDELRIGSRHRVVFAPALGALRILPAIADLDRDHRRHAALRDQIVERGVHVLPGGRAAVAEHDERNLCCRAHNSRGT